MSKFKVGEIAIYWEPNDCRHGDVVEILDILGSGDVPKQYVPLGEEPRAGALFYELDSCYITEKHLRKRPRPKEELSSWDQIEADCGYSPNREVVV